MKTMLNAGDCIVRRTVQQILSAKYTISKQVVYRNKYQFHSKFVRTI